MADTLIRNLAIPLGQILVVLGVVSLVVTYLTLLERKILGFMQLRLAPRRVGPHGILQPIADAVKLLIKEDIVPDKADRLLFTLAPILTIIPAFTALAVIPFSGGGTIDLFGYSIHPWIADVNVGVVFLLAISSLGVYGIMLGGWSSNSKYSMLGSLRSAAQMVSYEVPFGFSIIGVMMLSGTASMVGIVEAQRAAHVWYFVPQFLGLFLFFVSGVAETNRLPFDLPEAESELVAGFHTEYSGMKFALFFLAEYTSMIIIASIATTLFLGGWMRPFPNVEALGWLNLGLDWISPVLPGVFWFATKTFLVLFVYLWLRGTFPRYRYDQLMRLGWFWMIPLSIANVVATGLAVILAR
ncbi:MAG TPA: NADH-quinone oxidoreductase subunit NuoH [Candidatus Polarisedimenticolia bacterium]|jgi:NADH-quinone oxidoreductase subunit H|nr:NADH-quinone oxidoreductase subunit NuoH [Candidatus Polarisedimenticolia bacterium]